MNFRVPNSRTYTARSAAADSNLLRQRWLPITGAVILLAIVFATAWLYFRPQQEFTLVGPKNVPMDERWLGWWSDPGTRTYAGLPLWRARFEGRDCIAFEYYLVCHNDAGEQVALDEFSVIDLGRRLLPAALTPQHSRPAPVVQAYLDRLERAGVPIKVWFGPAISEPFCVSGSSGQPAECVQHFSQTHVRYPYASTDPDTVRIDQLGARIPRP